MTKNDFQQTASLVDAPYPRPPDSRPEGWVDQPRIEFSRTMVWIGFGIFVLAIAIALGSIYFRRTQLEQSRRFLGDDVIRAIQLAPFVSLEFDADKTDVPIDVTGTPGLGHLRHALLDERHYDWTTEIPQGIESVTTENPVFATLTFYDPRIDSPDHVTAGTVRLELAGGWVGTIDGTKRVQLISRAQPAVENFLTMLRNYQQNRYGDR